VRPLFRGRASGSGQTLGSLFLRFGGAVSSVEEWDIGVLEVEGGVSVDPVLCESFVAFESFD